jgi:hypothetical protein
MNNKSTNPVPWKDVRSWEDVKSELKLYLEADPRSKFEVIEKAGLSRDAYYKLFPVKKADESKQQADERKRKAKAPMRRGTVEGLANALNLTCMYPHGGLPSFSTKELLTLSLNAANTKDAVKYAINIAGSIESLAEKSNIPATELLHIMESESQTTSISIKTLHMIAHAINRTLIVFGDDSISLVDDLGHDPKMQPTLVRIDLATLAPVNRNYTPQILDNGLFKLMDNDIRLKHDITNDEIKVLSHIQDSGETNGTVEQWINILYAIRSLNSI